MEEEKWMGRLGGVETAEGVYSYIFKKIQIRRWAILRAINLEVRCAESGLEVELIISGAEERRAKR